MTPPQNQTPGILPEERLAALPLVEGMESAGRHLWPIATRSIVEVNTPIRDTKQSGLMPTLMTARSEMMHRPVRLTKREIEVITLIAQGHSSKECSETLRVSKRTVDFHLANIYDKLQVNNRVQAFRAATRLGLIPFEPTFNSVRGEV